MEQKQKQKRYVLGIDIGVASIGWAFIEEHPEQSKRRIVDMGVRINPLVNEKDDFKKGRAVSLNAKRTQDRGARRNRERGKQRRKKVARLLRENNMYPSEDLMHLRTYANEVYDIDKKDPVNYKLYALRARAAQKGKVITLQELGRVFLHMTQKRGYQSNRKTQGGDSEGTDYLRDIAINDAEIGEGKTIGIKFFEELKEDRDKIKTARKKGEHVPHEMTRTKSDSSNAPKPKEKKDGVKTNRENRVKSRKMYKAEFEQIWKVQKEFHGAVLTDELKKQIGERGIFFQRPLKSQKGKVSNCRFFSGNKVVAKSSPFFQSFRIWQNVNALMLEDDQLRNHPLSVAEKSEIFKQLNTAKEMKGEAVIKKILKLDYHRKYTLNQNKKQGIPINFEKIEGNRYNYELSRIFKKEKELFENIDTQKFFKFDPFVENPEAQISYKLWHVLYSVSEPEQLYRTLQKKDFGFNREQAEKLGGIYLEDDYASLSTRAIKQLLPYLIPGVETETGLVYSDACERIGFKHSDWEDNAERAERKAELKEKMELLAPIDKNELRNPIVEKILNQVLNLVNEIIEDEKFGGKNQPLDEIRIEFVRELRQNREQRAKTQQNIKKSTDRNNSIVEEIKKYNETHHTNIKISRKNIERWKLWEDSGKICIYSGEPIQMADVFSPHYNVEHIVPKALRYDDSLSNKVLAKRKENERKGARTAKDYMLEKDRNGEMSYMQYIALIKNNIKNPARIQKLQTDKDDLKNDKFVERQLKESQYIARELKKRLEKVCTNVTTTTGSITHRLREQWGLNQIMHELFPKDENGKTNKRSDHRHHAIDALVVACTERGIITHLNNLNSQGKDKSRKYKGWDIPLPWPGFTAEAKAKIREILISFKSKRRVASVNINTYTAKKGKGKRKVIGKQRVLTPRGQLHKETVYGRMKQCQKPKVKVSKIFKDNMIENIVHPAEREAVEQHLAQYEGDTKAAIKALKKTPIQIEGRKKPLTEVVVWKWVYTIRKPLVDLNKKQAGEIIAKDIREQVLPKFEEGKDLKKAIHDKPFRSNRGNGTVVKRVKIITDLKDPQALGENENGEPINFVHLRNNHHAAVYRDEKGKYYNDVVSFWEAFLRYKEKWKEKQELPHGIEKEPIDIIKKDNLDEGHEFVVSLSINEMFVKDLDPNAIDFKDSKNHALISKYLYRVQKLANKDYTLRYHLATTLDNKHEEVRITKLSNLENYTKVSINRLGMITDVQKITPTEK